MFGLAIHGGAGTLPRGEMGGEMERQYRSGLAAALDAGYAVLQERGTSLDAVTRAIVSPRTIPCSTQGMGSVFTLDGRNELGRRHHGRQHPRGGRRLRRESLRNPIELARNRHGAIRIRHAERFRGPRNSH